MAVRTDDWIARLDIPADRLDAARQHARLVGQALPDALIALGLASDAAIASGLAQRAGLPVLDALSPDEIDDTLCSALPLSFLQERLVLPIARTSDGVRVGVADPGDLAALDDLALLLGAPVFAVVVPAAALRQAIRGVGRRTSESAEAIARQFEVPAGRDREEIDLLVSEASPVVQFVHRVLVSALEVGASDVHFEPSEHHLRVRYRVDGLLRDGPDVPASIAPAVASRLKIMAELDVAEHRLPQDGRLRVRAADRILDLRVSAIPSAYGERLVMRLATPSARVLQLEQLGMAAATAARWRAATARAHGIVLVTGPTGSGKTMTLYSTLQILKSPTCNILTVEDPVEVRLPGITQVQVRDGIGLTFPVVLRSFLRQDPDILLVGEIRDRPTAEVAVAAALTGHLVLATLHTNDAATAFTRLQDLGVDAYKVADALVGVLAQRLVRRLCPECRVPAVLDPEDAAHLGVPDGARAWAPGGCPACDEVGYRGRIGLFELLEATDLLKDRIAAGASADALRRVALEQGFAPMRLDGGSKVAAGHTSASEVLRVV